MHSGPSSSWAQPRVLLVFGLLFTTGFLAGAVTMKLAGPARKPVTTFTLGSKDIAVQKLRRELDLTPEQAVKIQRILDDFVMYYQDVQGQMNEVRSNGKKSILSVLNESQRQRFEKLFPEGQVKSSR